MDDLKERLRERKASWIGVGMAPDKLCQEAAVRIEALERQIAAADKLAAWAGAISERKASPTTGGRLILERDVVGLETALAAYEATKEQSDGS